MIVDCPQCDQRHVIVERAPGTVARCFCGTEIRLPHNEIDAIKCANCGGNPPDGSTRCPYCDARLATLRCARCFATAVDGDQHCRACGHVLAVPVRQIRADAPDALTCPRCDQALVSILVGDAVLDECRRCGGEWVDHDVFDDVMRDRRDRDALLRALGNLRPADAKAAPPPIDSPSSGRFYVKCPQCRAVMDRRQFAHISGVVTDVCRAHGLWFDHDELRAVIAFVGDGGLERAEQYLHEKRTALAQRRRLASPVLASSDVPGGTSLAASLLSALVAILMKR